MKVLWVFISMFMPHDCPEKNIVIGVGRVAFASWVILAVSLPANSLVLMTWMNLP